MQWRKPNFLILSNRREKPFTTQEEMQFTMVLTKHKLAFLSAKANIDIDWLQFYSDIFMMILDFQFARHYWKKDGTKVKETIWNEVKVQWCKHTYFEEINTEGFRTLRRNAVD